MTKTLHKKSRTHKYNKTYQTYQTYKTNQTKKSIITTTNNATTPKNGITILTYNISWESMTGSKPDWVLCSNNVDTKHPKHKNVCVNNISNVINENPTDFICLQEAANYNLLISQIPHMQKMKYKEHKSGLENMVTFWDPKKFTFSKVVCGEFETGRPYMAIYSNAHKLCVVNVHFGHYNDEGELEKMQNMSTHLKLDYYHIKKGYRIIIAGDFNNNIKKLCKKYSGKAGNLSKVVNNCNSALQLNINNINFFVNSKDIKTCQINRRVHYDHIIDTNAPILNIYIPNVEYMASDHKPVIAVLSS